jgi:hypothetical protein
MKFIGFRTVRRTDVASCLQARRAADADYVLPPALDQGSRLKHRVEDLAIEKFVLELPIERLDIAIFPRTFGLDEERLHL